MAAGCKTSEFLVGRSVGVKVLRDPYSSIKETFGCVLGKQSSGQVPVRVVVGVFLSISRYPERRRPILKDYALRVPVISPLEQGHPDEF